MKSFRLTQLTLQQMHQIDRQALKELETCLALYRKRMAVQVAAQAIDTGMSVKELILNRRQSIQGAIDAIFLRHCSGFLIPAFNEQSNKEYDKSVNNSTASKSNTLSGQRTPFFEGQCQTIVSSISEFKPTPDAIVSSTSELQPLTNPQQTPTQKPRVATFQCRRIKQLITKGYKCNV